jgi:hypothetical protein
MNTDGKYSRPQGCLPAGHCNFGMEPGEQCAYIPENRRILNVPLKVSVKWLTPLIRTQDIPGSDFGPEAYCLD